MKKFLTVLLALSVVFTYSFSAVGSVFADADGGTLTDEQQAIYDAAVGPNAVILNAKFDAAWDAIADGEVADAAGIRYAVTKKAYKDLRTDALKAVTDAVYEAAKATDATVDTVSAVFASNAAILGLINGALSDDLARAQFAIDYATAVAKLDKVDITAYSTKEYPNEDCTHQEKAQAIINAAKDEAAEEAKKIDSDANLKACLDAKTAVDGIITRTVTEIMIDNIPSGEYELADTTVKKAADADADDAVTEAEKAALKAEVAKKVAAYKKTAGASADATLIAAYTEYYNVLIEAEEVKNTTAIEEVNGTKAESIKAMYKEVQKLVALGEKYKAEKDADGNLVRDAKKIDEIVEEETEAAYKDVFDGAGAWELSNAEAKIKAETVASTTAGLAFAKASAKAQIAKWVEDNSDNYYPAELAKINAIVAEFEAKVDAATKADTITNKTTGLKVTYQDKLDAVAKKAAVGTALAAKPAFQSAETALNSYVNYYNGALDAADKATKTIDKTAIADALKEFYGEKGARTETELKALKNDVLSIVDTLPTAGAQAAAKKAAQDAIDALPAVITLADEAVVQAAVDAVKAYKELKGTALDPTYETNLDKARTALYNAYKLDLSKKVNAVDKTDKAALKALLDEFEAAQDKVGDVDDGKCLKGNDFNTITAYDTVDKALTAIKDAEKAAVEKAINALPINITLADKAQIEAARALYDAYVAEYTDYEKGINAADDFKTIYRDLALAEAALSVLEKDAKVKAVESFKIKTTTKRYDGKKMRVNWTVTAGDESAIDGYRIYFSTKKTNSGYKYLAKTSKKYINHTSIKKNVKKGTRVYYRVRAYVEIDGQRYFSDYSTVGNRIWK